MSFGDLSSDAGLTKLNAFLSTRSYIEGFSASQADVDTYHKVQNTVSSQKFPHVARWYHHIALFSNQQRTKFRAAGPIKHDEVKTETKTAPKAAAKKEEVPVVEDEPEMSFDDLDGAAPDPEVEALLKKKAAEAEAAKPAKPKKEGPAPRSNVILDVKPEDDETDLKVLEAEIRGIAMEGLHWGGSQLEPIAFGLKKLRIIAIVHDDIVSVDDLQERIEAFPGVQSTDIHAFNKV